MSGYVSRFGAAVPFSGIATGAYVVKISGIQYMCLAGSLKIDLSVGRRSQASFYLYTDNKTHFQQYQPVTIFDEDGDLVFSGYISSPKEQKMGFQGSLYQTITAIDQHYLADKRIIAKVYTNQTCGVIVTDIVTNYLAAEGVTLVSVFDGLLPSSTLYPGTNVYPQGNVGIIPTVTFAYCTVAQALDALVTEASSAGDQYYWMIDERKNLWFQPYTANTNVTVVDGTFIDQLGTPCTVTRANPKYRNVEYITGGVAQTASMTEHHAGDGQGRTFTVGYDVFSVSAITVNGVSQVIALKGPNATGAQWYWAQGDKNITQDSSQPVLGSTDNFAITYIGEYPIVVQLQDQAKIANQAAIDGTSGIIEVADEDKSIIDLNTAKQEVAQYIARYGVPGTTVQFSTPNDYGFRPGQLVQVNLNDHGLNQEMLIETVSITDQPDSYNIWYTISCIAGPYDTTWVSFYSDLLTRQRPATDISVGNATNTPPIIVTGTTQTFTATRPAAVATLTATVNGGSSSGGGNTYPIITIPSTACSGTGIANYTTTSDQPIRFIVFKDNDNTGAGNTNQYVYGGNVLLYWSDIEQSEGNRNWAVVEAAINNWSNQGKKAILRVSTCGQAGWTTKYNAAQGTPSWVLSAMGSGTSYNAGANGNKGVVPQYWNSTFMTKFDNFITALAAKYNGDTRIEFVQAAVGMGGECKPDTTVSTTPTTTDINHLKSIGFGDTVWMNFIKHVANLYQANFTRTKLGFIPGAFFDSHDFSDTTKFSTSDVVSYVKPLGYGLQNDGIGGKGSNGTVTYTPPDPTWASATFISAEQRDPIAQTGDSFECDIQAIVSYCQYSKPIYALCFSADLLATGNQTILSKYASVN